MIYIDTTECPYCGHENDMSDGCTDLSDDCKFDHECDDCGEEFEVEVYFEPTYSASKIIYYKCGCCKSEVREVYKKGFTLPYPKKTKATELCKTCYLKLLWSEK